MIVEALAALALAAGLGGSIHPAELAPPKLARIIEERCFQLGETLLNEGKAAVGINTTEPKAVSLPESVPVDHLAVHKERRSVRRLMLKLTRGNIQGGISLGRPFGAREDSGAGGESFELNLFGIWGSVRKTVLHRQVGDVSRSPAGVLKRHSKDTENPPARAAHLFRLVKVDIGALSRMRLPDSHGGNDESTESKSARNKQAPKDQGVLVGSYLGCEKGAVCRRPLSAKVAVFALAPVLAWVSILWGTWGAIMWERRDRRYAWLFLALGAAIGLAWFGQVWL